MNEFVVRMEVPGSCLECPFFNKVGCKASGMMFPDWLNVAVRPKGCPIIAVLPEKHGELIDRQAVYEKIKWWQENTHDTVTKAMLHEFYLMLFGVPAIVPATEGGNRE